MIDFQYYEDGKYKYFEVEGHAGHRVIGFDEVCGMVSVLAQSALYGCEKHGKVIDPVCESGKLKFKLRKTDIVGIPIMDSCAYGIMEVRRQYPHCFTKEVMNDE